MMMNDGVLFILHIKHVIRSFPLRCRRAKQPKPKRWIEQNGSNSRTEEGKPEGQQPILPRSDQCKERAQKATAERLKTQNKRSGKGTTIHRTNDPSSSTSNWIDDDSRCDHPAGKQSTDPSQSFFNLRILCVELGASIRCSIRSPLWSECLIQNWIESLISPPLPPDDDDDDYHCNASNRKNYTLIYNALSDPRDHCSSNHVRIILQKDSTPAPKMPLLFWRKTREAEEWASWYCKEARIFHPSLDLVLWSTSNVLSFVLFGRRMGSSNIHASTVVIVMGWHLINFRHPMLLTLPSASLPDLDIWLYSACPYWW